MANRFFGSCKRLDMIGKQRERRPAALLRWYPRRPFGSPRSLLPAAALLPLILACAFLLLVGEGDAGAQSVGAPAAPAGVSVSGDSMGLATTVRWDAVTGADRYRVYRSANASFERSPSTLLGASRGISFRDDRATAGKTLYYKVSAVDAQGVEGAASAEVVVTTVDGLPTSRQKAADWLLKQRQAAQGFRTVFDQAYAYDYSGPVSGSVGDAASLPGARTADAACPNGGKVGGVEVRVFSVTDAEYMQGAAPVCADGSWSLGLARAGTKVARLHNTATNNAISSSEDASASPYAGLARSFSVPLDDPAHGYNAGAGKRFEQRGFVYDAAVSVYASLAAGDAAGAKAALSQLEGLQAADGSLRFWYDVHLGRPMPDDYVRSGALAWVGGAALAYEEKTGDASFRPFARRIGDHLRTMQVATTGEDPRYGSIKGGRGRYTPTGFDPAPVDWASTEHNVDAYFFLRDLGYATKAKEYADAADAVKQSLLTNHWNAAEGRFYQGVGPAGPDASKALDVSSWGGLFLLAVGERQKAEASAAYAEQFRVSGATISKSPDDPASDPTYNQTYESLGPMDGYKPYLAGGEYSSPPETVWAEGTWGAILLRMRLGQDVSADLSSMQRLQDADPAGGFLQATKGSKAHEFRVWPAVGGTGWASLVMGNSSLLWKPDGWMAERDAVDRSAPAAEVTSGPSGPVANSTAPFSWKGSDAETPATDLEYSYKLDAAAWSAWSATTSATLPGVGEGAHTFYVKARDRAGNETAPPAERAFSVDTQAPAANPPTGGLVSPSQLGATAVPVKLDWSAADTGGSGVARYELERSTNAGAYAAVALPVTTTTSITPSLDPGTHRFRVRAQDNAGNWSAWSEAPSFVLSAPQENGAGVTYPAGTWTSGSSTSFYGGAVKYVAPTALGPRARYAFTGSEVAFVTTKGNRGKAEVWVDGVKQTTLDLYASTTQVRQVAYRKVGLDPAVTHTIEVRPTGTKNASNTSSSGTRVDVDAFVSVK